jgi:replicative DNA helicase
MNNLNKTLLGILMEVKPDQVKACFGKVKQEWFKETSEQTIYTCIQDLIVENKEVNLLTVTSKLLQENNRQYVVYASDCISLVTSNSMLYNYDALIEIIKLEYLNRGVVETHNQLVSLVSTEIDLNKYIEILEKGIVQFNAEMLITEDSTMDVVMNVLSRHEKAKKGELGGIVLGYPKIDNDILLEPVDLMVIGARPAMGKTSFGVSLTTQLAFHENKKVVFFNLEMSNAQLMRRIIANLTGIDSNKIKNGYCTNDELNRIHTAVSMPQMKNITLIEGSHNIQQIKMKLTKLKYANSVDIFIVDYLQKITPTKNKSRYEQVTEVSNGLKYICQNMKIPCIAFAQLGRDAGKHGNRPILPDLRESGEIEQDASIVAFLHRPEYYGKDFDDAGNSMKNFAEFIVAKNREGDTPIVEFNLDLQTSKWIVIQNNGFTPNKTTYEGFNSDNPF